MPDEFGGIALDEAPSNTDEWGGISVEEAPAVTPSVPSLVRPKPISPASSPIPPAFESPIEITQRGPVFPSTLEAQKSGSLTELDPTTAWMQRLRRSEAVRGLMGPTSQEREEGRVPGQQPGVIPILLSAPLPFGPGPETKAGKALLSGFIAQFATQAPTAWKSFQDAAQRGDWQEAGKIALETGFGAAFTALAGKGLHDQLRSEIATPRPPTVTETTPVVPPDKMPSTPSQTGLYPGVRKIGGETEVGEPGQTHPQIIKEKEITPEEIDQRVLVQKQPEGTGLVKDREQSADILRQQGIEPTREPGRAHSTDLPEAQEPPAPVAPTTPKRKYSGEAYRASGAEFKRLVMEYGEQMGWIKNPDFINPNLEGYSAISHNTEMTAAYKRALKDIGITTDRNTLKLHSESLPKLKAFLEAHSNLQPVALDQIPDGSEFTILGEKYTVKGTNPDTGVVTIQDGRTLKVNQEGAVNIDPGSLKATPVSTEFVPPEAPKLRAGEKGTGELLQGAEAPFNLAGETAIDPARISAERAKAEQTRTEAAAIVAKQQQDLFGTAALEGRQVAAVPEPPPGERLVTVERPDGSKYVASFADKSWETPRGPTPAVAKLNAEGQWSHGMAGTGEKIIEDGGRGALEGRTGFVGKPLTTESIWQRLQEQHGIKPGGVVDVINDPKDVSSGRILYDTKTNKPRGIQINQAQIPTHGSLDWVIQHEAAHWFDLENPNATTGLRDTITSKEWNDIQNRIEKAGYDPSVHNAERTALAMQALADAWKGRNWFEKLVGNVSRFASDVLGIKLSRKAAESTAVRALAQSIKRITEAEPIEGAKLSFEARIPKGVTDAVNKAAEYVKAIHDEELKAPKMTDRRRAVLNWSAKLQWSFNEAEQKQRAIIKAVPKPIRREGITNWIQADGDKEVLRQRADATVDPKLRAGYEAALNLTPEEIAIANQVKTDYADFAQRGKAADVLGQLKENYVTQTWDLGKGPVAAGIGFGRTLKEKFRFSRASTFANFFEGEQAGYKPKTKDIAKLLPMYSHEMNSVIAAREMVKQMGKGVASDGRPLLAPKGVGVPVESEEGGKATLVMPKVGKEETSDYKVLPNQPALSGWKWVAKDDSGNPVFLKADLALHPEAFTHLKNILGRSAIRDWYSTRTTALAEIPKMLVRGIDMANSETKRTMLGLLATFHQIQTGTHAIGHRVNPTFSIPKVDLVNNPVQMDAARHGLMMAPDRASMDQFMEGFRTSGLISRIPAIGPIADWYGHYLFHDYIPGLKFKTYGAILKRNLGVYEKPLKAGNVKVEDIKVLSAEQANAAYGHINYADLGRNPTMQHIAQLGLLAPDFLEARGRFAGQAIKGITGARVGREQLLALATLAIAQGVLAYTTSKLTDGQWDWKRPFEFVKGNRRYTLRSVPEDVQNLVTKTRQFVHSRLSPLIGKGALQYLTGVDYRGQKVKALETTKELAAQPIPLTIRGFTGLGKSTLSGMEQLAGSLGLRISRYSPTMDLHDLIVNFKKASPDARVQSEIELQEKEVFASVYEKLRAALHNQDLDAARKEYDRLKGVRTAKEIDNAMKPWTGGNINVRTMEVSPRNPKPFTGSAKTEAQFVRTLTPDQRDIYDKARAERVQFYQTFRQMLQQPKTKTTDEFGGIPLE